MGPRIVGIIVVVALLAFSVFIWFAGFTAKTRSEFTALQIATLIGIGGLIVAVLYALVRSRVTATQAGLIVVNGYRKRAFVWAQVVAVRLPSGAPWVTLDLVDGSTCPAMGIQSSDGDHARAQVRQLRALLEAHSAPSA
ncbi:PH domain-containing protein [Nocardioides baekrokdamisoli]|nr:PH domain-containing protein [Nocardioides baekrokdamisoli]